MHRRHLEYLLLLVVAVLCATLIGVVQAGEYSIPQSVEDVLPSSDLIVLGKVTKKDTEATIISGMVMTRHTLKVETYYKGTGPQEIDLLPRVVLGMRRWGTRFIPSSRKLSAQSSSGRGTRSSPS